MFTTHHNAAFPTSLERLLWKSKAAPFVLKAVLVKDIATQQWALLGAVARPLHDQTAERTIYEYPSALLLSIQMSASDVLEVLNSVAQGHIKELHANLEFTPPRQSSTHQVPIDNPWMTQAGVVYDIQVRQQVNAPHQDRLVAADAPYYPDAMEAARHWLELGEHFGSSSSDLGHLYVLIPETRAYFQEFAWKDELLEVYVAGSLESSDDIHVIGASWVGKSIHHLSGALSNGRTVIAIPEDADRLELLVIDSLGGVYDFHREDTRYALGSRTVLEGRRAMSSNLEVEKAIRLGEGPRTEFKEFLDIPKAATPPGEKDKLQQVLKTVAAFANADGGTIYFGVSDACEIVGTAEHVAKWVSGESDAVAVDRYMGALRAKVHDFIYPSVTIETRTSMHTGLLVIALEVKRSAVPVSLRHDTRLFERRGSSNMAVAPSDWRWRETSTFSQERH